MAIAARPPSSSACSAEGTCWVGPTVYLGRTAMRVSISNWSTTEMDVDRSIAAIATIGRQCS
jgi:hypothetical protein